MVHKYCKKITHFCWWNVSDDPCTIMLVLVWSTCHMCNDLVISFPVTLTSHLSTSNLLSQLLVSRIMSAKSFEASLAFQFKSKM